MLYELAEAVEVKRKLWMNVDKVTSLLREGFPHPVPDSLTLLFWQEFKTMSDSKTMSDFWARLEELVGQVVESFSAVAITSEEKLEAIRSEWLEELQRLTGERWFALAGPVNREVFQQSLRHEIDEQSRWCRFVWAAL